MTEKLVGLNEAAVMLGIASKGKRPGLPLWEGIRKYGWDVPYVRVGRRMMFLPSDILGWIARKRENGHHGNHQARRGG